MITINMPATASAAEKELRAVMQGKVVMAGEADYARVLQIWNGAGNRRGTSRHRTAPRISLVRRTSWYRR